MSFEVNLENLRGLSIVISQMLNYKIVKNSLILSWISERMKTFPYYKNSFEVFGPIRPDMVRCHLSQKGSGQGDKCA